MRESREAPLYDVAMRSRFDLGRLANRRDSPPRRLSAHPRPHRRTALVGRLASASPACRWCITSTAPPSHDTTRRWRDRINGLVERLSLRRWSRVIAVSRAMAEHMRGGFDPGRIAVVPNGVPRAGRDAGRDEPGGRWTLGVVALSARAKGSKSCWTPGPAARGRVPVHLRAVGTFESPSTKPKCCPGRGGSD